MKQSILLAAGLTAALALAALNTHAANLWWDPVPGTAGPGDGPGTWGNDAGNLNWWNGAANVPWNPGDTAVFGVNSNIAVTVTITNPVVAGGIIFSNAGAAAYTVIGGAATSIPLAVGTNLTLTGASPTILLAAHDVTHAQAVDIVSASIIAPNGLRVRAATTSTNGFVRFGHATNYIVGSLSVGTPGNASYGGSTALYCDFNTPTDSAAVGINFVMTGATNVTVYSNATLRISNQNGSQWNPPFPQNLTISGDGRNGVNGAWVITGNGNGIFNGNVILAGDSTIEINSGTAGRTYTLYQPITGNGRLQIVCGSAGKHTLQLTNASTYVGNTIIAGGTTLRLQAANDRLPVTTALTLGSQTTPVANWNREGVLILGNATSAVNQTLTGLRSDAGGLDSLCRVIGGNTTNLSWLAVNNVGSNYYGGAIGGTATADRNLGLVVNGGTLLLTGTNLANGGFTLSGGTLQFGDGFSDYPLAGSITNNGTMVLNVASALAYGDVISGAGSLIKRGGGTATLTGTNTYAGITTIEAGKLSLPTTKVGTGAILVTTYGAELEVRLSSGAPTLTTASAAVDSATLDFNLNQNSPGGTAPLTVTGAFTNSGYTTINVLSFGPLSPGTFPLVKYGSYRSNDYSSFNLNSLGAGVTAAVQNNAANSSIDLVITALNGLKWTGATDTNWDTSTINWVNAASGTPTTYTLGSFALFDDSGTNTAIWLNADPQPTSVTVSNNTRAYSFNGFAGIGGSAALIKQGTGTLTVAVNNNNSGGTFIQKGTLQVGDGAVDGTITAPITDNGALIFSTFNSSTAGGITGTGTVTKTGSGQLNLGGTSSYTGATTVQQGRLYVTSSTALGATNSGTTVQAGTELWVDAGGLNIPEPLTIGGVGVDGAAGALNASANAVGSTWSGKITVTSNTVFTAVSGASLTLSGGVNASTNALLFQPNNTASFTVSSNLAARAVVLNDSGGLFLAAANDTLTNIAVVRANPTSGSISPTAGLTAYDSHAFGTNCTITLTNGDLIGNSGAILRLGNNVSIPPGVSLNVYVPSDGNSGAGAYRATFGVVGAPSTNTWNGPITVHGADPASGFTSLFIVRPESATLVLNNTVRLADGAATLFFRGGSASTVINGTINWGTNLLTTTADGAAGTLTINSTGNIWGETTLNTTTLRLGTNNAIPVTTALQLQNASATLDLNGFNQQLGSLTGTGVVVSHATNTHSTLTIQATTNWTFGGALVLSGVFGSKQFGLDVASGGLTLTSTANSYAGPTVIRNGATLALSGVGTIQGSDIAVQAGGTFDVSARNDGAYTTFSDSVLSGNGIINGSVTNRGILSPGSSIGTLTVTTNVVLAGGGKAWMEVNNASVTRDLLGVGGTLTYGGTLVVTNVSVTPYTNNQVLKLFNAAGGYAGSFTNIVFPGVTSYDTTQLTVDGTIKVLSVIPSTPTNISFSMSGGNLTISWPASYTGWRLQAQTNTLSIGISNNWVTVPGSTTVNSKTFPIDAANGTVFFRLVYP